MERASIRYKNPGAMWGSPLAIKWGASPNAVTLKDGKGQGNNIAVFPSYVRGICAQLDLWRSSKHYRNKRFADAIRVWSGGNNVEEYIAFVLKRVPGMTRDTIMDDAFWRGANGIAFLKAQAWHEAGKPYPAPDGDWTEARRRVLGDSPTVSKRAESPATLPTPTTVPQTKQDAKEAGYLGAAVASVTSFLYAIWGNWAFRVALFALIAAAVYWFVVRPVLRRIWALDEVEVGTFAKLRLALKGIKTTLFSWLLGIAGVALPILSYVNDVDLSAFLPDIYGVPASMYQYVILAGVGWAVNRLRQATNTAVGQTDLGMVEAPPIAPETPVPIMAKKPARPKAKRKAKKRKKARA